MSKKNGWADFAGKISRDVNHVVNQAAKEAGKFGENVGTTVNQANQEVQKFLDQDGDGKFGMSDVKQLSSTAGKMVADATQVLAQDVVNLHDDAEMNRLQPIFAEDIKTDRVKLSDLILLEEKDEAHRNSSLCNGSIGHRTFNNHMTVVHLYRSKINDLDLAFIPNNKSTAYYVDPLDSTHYIALGSYFSYLQKAIVAEFVSVSFDLGAQSYQVRYIEDSNDTKKTGVRMKETVKYADIQEAGNVQIDRASSTLSSSTIEASGNCSGGLPHRPELRYLRNDKNIESLIEKRLSTSNVLYQERCVIEMSDVANISESVITQINGALKGMKVGVEGGFSNKVKKEFHSKFEYVVNFSSEDM